MTEAQAAAIYASAVAVSTAHLALEELCILHLKAYLGGNPRTLPFYDKVSPLFTEEGGTKMHPVAIDALVRVVEARRASERQGGA
jgi:hypothetical protein